MYIQNLIPLVATYLSSPMVTYWFYPALAVAFVATVPAIVRCFVRR